MRKINKFDQSTPPEFYCFLLGGYSMIYNQEFFAKIVKTYTIHYRRVFSNILINKRPKKNFNRIFFKVPGKAASVSCSSPSGSKLLRPHRLRKRRLIRLRKQTKRRSRVSKRIPNRRTIPMRRFLQQRKIQEKPTRKEGKAYLLGKMKESQFFFSFRVSSSCLT